VFLFALGLTCGGVKAVLSLAVRSFVARLRVASLLGRAL
jgi:hypothetical protein